MKRFMETNTVTHNLMSFSGFKSLLIFSMLVEGPKTYEEIIENIENNEYLKETISKDTIRIYMNSLKKVGCDIKKIYEGRTVKYYISSHPFELKITDAQADSIIKIYKAISGSIELGDFILLQNFFDKISEHITNEKLKLQIKNLSPISNLNSSLIKELAKYTKDKTEITILYNAKNSKKKKEITILPDKMHINNHKLYITGYNSEYQNYGEFPVNNIIKIVSVNIDSPKLEIPGLTVTYKYLKTDNTNFEILNNEKIIEETNDYLIIEIFSKNKFEITQRILSFTNKCIVLSPDNYKNEIISCLLKMKEGYIEEQQF